MARLNVLLIDCPDEKGIVHKVTGVLFRHGLNIAEQGEFVAEGNAEKRARFFMRTAFTGEHDSVALEQELCATVSQDARVRLARQEPKPIVVCVTREAHCLGDLLIRHAYGELNARILAVVGNRARLGDLVRRFDLPFHHVPAGGLTREEHERRVLDVLDGYGPTYLVLAKYMRILTADFVDRYKGHIINIHHSFLPAFIGARPYHQAFERGVKIIGATAHIVTESLDEGPIIAQDIVRIDHSKDVRSLTRAGHNVETAVLAEALRLVFEDRVFVHGNRTIIFG